MLSALRSIRSPARRVTTQYRTAATQAQKRAGDISDAFVSLSGQDFKPLAPEYADLKRRLVQGHESEVRDSWDRLLRDLRTEIPLIVELGSKVIPEIDFRDIDNAPETFSNELRKRGVAVVRGVVPEQEVLQWKDHLKEYIRQNPQTTGKNDLARSPLTLANHPASLSSRQSASLRTLLVTNPAPRTRQSEHAEDTSLPYVILAQPKPTRASLDPASDQLRRPTTNALTR
jgi:hypothetical protein